jgi:hypothetical protein
VHSRTAEPTPGDRQQTTLVPGETIALPGRLKRKVVSERLEREDLYLHLSMLSMEDDSIRK